MKPVKLLLHPLLAATVGLGLALCWAGAYYLASEQARQAGASIRPLTELARTQLADVGACEARSFEGSGLSADILEQAAERRRAFECAAPYLLAQPRISAAAAAQALGYAAGAAYREARPGSAPLVPVLFDKLSVRAESDARAATQLAETADAITARACSGFLSTPACALSGLAPDRPERRLADSMREFEIDLRAQRYIVKSPNQEAAYRSRAADRDPEGRFSPAYIQARREMAVRIIPVR